MEISATGMAQRCQDAEKECALLREQLRAEQLKVKEAAPSSLELLAMRNERNMWKDEWSKVQLELACLKVQPGNSKDSYIDLEWEVTRLKDLHAISQRECHTLQDEVAQLKDDLHQEIKRASACVAQEQQLAFSAYVLKTVGLRPPTASASRGCRLQPEPEAEMSRPPTATLLRPAAAHALRQLEAHPTLQLGTSSTSLEPEADMSPGSAINSYEPEAEASRPNSSASLRRPMSASTRSLRPLSAASESETIRPMSAAGSRGCSRSNVWAGRVNPRWDTAEFLRSEALILGEARETEMVFCNTVSVVLEEGVFQSPSVRGSSPSDDEMGIAHEDSLDVDVNCGPLLDSSCQELAGSIGRALRKGGNSTASLLNHKDPLRAKPASASTQQEEADLTPSSSRSASSNSLRITAACELPEMQTQSTAIGSIGVQSAASTFQEHEAADESCSHNLSDLLTITTSTEAMMWSQKSIDLMSPAGTHAEFSDSTLWDGRNEDSTWLDSTPLTDITILDSALLAANSSVQDVVVESPSPIACQSLSRCQVDQEESFKAPNQYLHTAEEIHTAEEGSIQKAEQQQQVAQEAYINARYRAEEEANWNAMMQEDERLRSSTSAPDDLTASTLLGAKRLLAPLQVQGWGVDVSSSSVQGSPASASKPHSRCQSTKEESHNEPNEELHAAKQGTMQKAQQQVPQKADVDVCYKAETNQSTQQETCSKAEDEQKWTPRRTWMKRNLERRGAQVEESTKEVEVAQTGNLLLAVKLRKKAQQEASSKAETKEKEKNTYVSNEDSQREEQEKYVLEKGLREKDHIDEKVGLEATPKTQQKKLAYFAAEPQEKDEEKEACLSAALEEKHKGSMVARHIVNALFRKLAYFEAQEEAQQQKRQECWGDSMTYVDEGFSSARWGYNAWVPQDVAPGSLRLEAELNEASQLGSQLYYSGKAKLKTLQDLLEQGQIAAGLPLSRINRTQAA